MTVQAVPAQAPRVRYVYIPADLTEELQERELVVPEGREVESLLDELKAHFKRVGGAKTDAQREAQRQALLSQVGSEAAGRLNSAMMDAALDMQMVETLPLLVNNPASGYVGVNMYCDDQAQVKELPINLRASQIADCCGRPTQVRGDAFLARLFDNDDAFVRLDLGLAEVASGAAWVGQAAQQAAARAREGDRAADFMAKLQAGNKAAAKRPAATVRELSPAEAEKEAGNAAVRGGDWAAAVSRYSAALALDPALTAAANNRALALLRLGRHQEAERDCCQVLAAEPRNVKALLRRAAARAATGRAAEAAEDLRAVLALEPRNTEAATQLAAIQTPPPPPPLPPTAATQQQDEVATETLAVNVADGPLAGTGVEQEGDSSAGGAAAAVGGQESWSGGPSDEGLRDGVAG